MPLTFQESSSLAMLVVAARPEYRDIDPIPTATMWAKLFAGYTFQQMEAAINRVLLTVKRGWPSPAEIQEALDELDRASRREGAPPTTEEAWEEVKKKIASPAGSLKWSHPYIDDAVAKMGGSRAIGMSDENDRSVPARFYRIYDAILYRQQAEHINRQALAALGVKINLLGGGSCELIQTDAARRRSADPLRIDYRADDARTGV